MHGHSMVSVYRCIDMSLLPEEYLPDDFEGNCAGNLIDITGKFIHYNKRYGVRSVTQRSQVRTMNVRGEILLRFCN